MTYDEIKKQLDSEYDRAIRETLAKLKKKKPLTKHKLAELLFKANKAYWAARLALLDSESVDSADRFAMSLAVPYATAAQTFSDRVRNIYAGYQSAFDLTQKDAKELLDKVVYDRTIAESLQKIAEDMPDGEDKTRILAEISAPAYRYRLQRAEQLAEQAKEVCNNIARGEIDADRKFLQTETEKAYNITVDEALRGTPADAILDEILPEPIQLRFNEMPKASEPVQDFTPTEDKGVLDSFSLTSTKHVSEITETDWKGRDFSDSVWNNTDKLAQEIKQVLIEGELTGKSEADMAAKIVERFEVGMHAARRVVRTESNYCTNQAELKGMKDAGFDEYEFISLGEEAEDVCRVCDDLDGQRFKIADAVVGVNCPPMHPFCRCKVTTPQETEEDIQREIDERIDSWNIPEGMSLDEFIERVNNGELEEIRAEQAAKENSSEGERLAGKFVEKVDKSQKSDIIKKKGFDAVDRDKVVNILRKDSAEWIKLLLPEEIRALEKYTLNWGDTRETNFFMRLNAMLRGDLRKDDVLLYYANHISNAISKFDLKHDIICYRSLKTDIYNDKKVGDYITEKQFISTTVVKSRALNYPFLATIKVPEGSNGAYIENISHLPNQREFLLNTDLAYKVLSKTDDSIEMEVVI